MTKIISIIGLFISINSYAQTVKGKLIDSESKSPISFATISIERNNKQVNTNSDSTGFFRLDNLEVGRYTVIISCVGYEPTFLKELLVNSGKQSDLLITMLPKINLLNEVTIKPSKQEPNYVSAHTVSIEQTNRYAATWGDPARMAMSFAGVTSVNDQSNELVIRGNSPKGLLWMIEGVEVPSPNHFSAEGASGGLISALNTTVLRNSTFYTGAFPANYGNATSGVFDVRFRNGNSEKWESNINIGLLGVDAGSEGPISKKKNSSYLINYRFANTKLIQSLGLVNVLKVATPRFQDITFKLNFPFKKANFSLWGVGGKNVADFTLQSFLEINNRANLYASGANLAVQLNKNVSWETILSFSGSGNINNNSNISFDQTRKQTSELSYSYLRLSSNFTKKIDGSNTVQIGSILSNLSYQLLGQFDFAFINLNIKANDKTLDENGSTQYLQNYVLWKKRGQKTMLNMGLNSSYFILNKQSTFEPRVSAKYELTKKSSLNIGLGLHSRLEPISVYLYKNNLLLNGKTVDNKNLGIAKSLHSIVGFTIVPNDKWRLNTEMYYQRLFNIGIGDTTLMTGIKHISLINQLDAINLYPLVGRGTGQNYGWEVTAERSLSQGYYFVFTSSIYKSTYKIGESEDKPTRFNNRFVFNLLTGREWQIGKSLLNVNIRNTWAGGIRAFPYRIINGSPIYDNTQGYSDNLPNFYRLDLKINYILNFKKTTSTFSLDINNLTNRDNPLTRIYNPITKNMDTINQLGLLPVLNYRINF
jgi:CarboxypepD_reg-like domain